MPNEWIPSKRDFIVEGLALLAIPAGSATWNIIDEQSVNIIIAMTLGSFVLVLAAIYFWEALIGPRRRRFSNDREIMNAIDSWLRDSGQARALIAWQGYSQALAVTRLTNTTFIGKIADRDVLIILASRTEGASETPLLDNMKQDEWINFRYDLSAEVSRSGAFYTLTENPFAVTFFDLIAVGRSLTQERFMDRFYFITRVDHLITLLASKHLGLVALRGTVQPPTVDPSSLSGESR